MDKRKSPNSGVGGKSVKSKTKRLSPKEQRFVVEYCANGFNATQAAAHAGYTFTSAAQRGHEMLTRPHVLHAVATKCQELLKQVEVTAEEVLQALANRLRMNPADLCDANGEMITDLRALPQCVHACIDGFKVTQWQRIRGSGMQKREMELKLTPMASTVEKLMKYFGMFEKDNSRKVNLEGSITFDFNKLFNDNQGRPNPITKAIQEMKVVESRVVKDDP